MSPDGIFYYWSASAGWVLVGMAAAHESKYVIPAGIWALGMTILVIHRWTRDARRNP